MSWCLFYTKPIMLLIRIYSLQEKPENNFDDSNIFWFIYQALYLLYIWENVSCIIPVNLMLTLNMSTPIMLNLFDDNN